MFYRMFYFTCDRSVNIAVLPSVGYVRTVCSLVEASWIQLDLVMTMWVN